MSSTPEDVDDELHGDVQDDAVDFVLPPSPVSAQLVDVRSAAGVTQIQIIVKLKPSGSTETHKTQRSHSHNILNPMKQHAV